MLHGHCQIQVRRHQLGCPLSQILQSTNWPFQLGLDPHWHNRCIHRSSLHLALHHHWLMWYWYIHQRLQIRLHLHRYRVEPKCIILKLQEDLVNLELAFESSGLQKEQPMYRLSVFSNCYLHFHPLDRSILANWLNSGHMYQSSSWMGLHNLHLGEVKGSGRVYLRLGSHLSWIDMFLLLLQLNRGQHSNWNLHRSHQIDLQLLPIQ